MPPVLNKKSNFQKLKSYIAKINQLHYEKVILSFFSLFKFLRTVLWRIPIVNIRRSFCWLNFCPNTVPASQMK